MRRTQVLSALLLAASALAAPVGPPVRADEEGKKKVDPAKAAKSVLDFKVKDIDGKDVDLAKYKGHVIMVVNVASK